MGRIKGSKNKIQGSEYNKVALEDRLKIIANLVIERILEEQRVGKLEQVIKMTKQNG